MNGKWVVRDIDSGLAAWVHARTGSPLLSRAVEVASAAEGEGHACALLDAFDEAEIEALHSHAWVGDGNAFSPFVLDAARGRFWLWRNWRHEQRLADALRARCAASGPPLPRGLVDPAIDILFAGSDARRTGDQRTAVAAVPGSRLFVLTGGPGTGKTSTVVRMLLMLLCHATTCGLPLRPSIALAAPTGKAARHLAAAIARGKAELAARLPEGSAFTDLLAAIPHEQAATLHRLLGYRPHSNGFAYGKHQSLPADIVVVDEASMVDLAMMRQLVDALAPSSVLVLLGDPDQLASVDAGSVLADIVAGARSGASPLRANVVALREVWRAGGSLQASLAAIREGDAGWTTNAADAAQGVVLRECSDAKALHARIDAWLERRAEAHARLFGHIDAEAAFTLLRETQVLCALRDGPFGASGVNARIVEMLAVRCGFDATRAWYHGRPVVVTRNDYAHGLFNGDVGIALDGADGLRVWFQGGTRDGGGWRSFPPRVLTACETAWAITIHRSQGSEYDDVAVVLPPEAEHRLLSRELLYTAVSRARRGVELWATPEALQAALARRVTRHGGLVDRLAAA
jgi:exodeoxyribonuclease V alpha subunit